MAISEEPAEDDIVSNPAPGGAPAAGAPVKTAAEATSDQSTSFSGGDSFREGQEAPVRWLQTPDYDQCGIGGFAPDDL